MKTEDCRHWRESLGAYALNQLDEDERIALEAHLEGCPGCRAEAEALLGVARLLPLADPARVESPAPQPPTALGERIAERIGGERKLRRRRRTRTRLGFACAGAAATAVVLAIVLLPGNGETSPEQHVEFASLPAGIRISATLEPHAYGTEIRMYVHGVRSGTLCTVFLRGPRGETVPAGTFRYRYGDDSDARLSSALDLSRTEAIGVRAGNRTFIAPVELDGTAAIDDHEGETT
jgi:Putative zinc-finger